MARDFFTADTALLRRCSVSLLRVGAPAPIDGNRWTAYRDRFEVVASIGERHTASPGRAWLAICEGHGFEGPRPEWRGRILPLVRRNDERATLNGNGCVTRTDGVTRPSALRWSGFRASTGPAASYYLLEGSVRAVTKLRYPDGDDWRHPDLFWPDDRRWFVATDVDFWSLYIGGPSGFTAEVADSVPRSEPVALDLPLDIED